MSSTVEVEIKLTGDAKALAKAWRAAPLRGDPASEEITRTLENVYFDTADFRLRKLGYAFRIRKDGTRLVQTLKSNDEGGKTVARRREWSSPVTALEPDLGQMGDAATREEIGLLLPGELAAVFVTKVRRCQRLVKLPGPNGQISVIEAAYDRGEILAKGSKAPIREIEFELQRGAPAAIHSLISDVLATAALRIETRSKSARGYALAAGKAPAWQKAGTIALTTQEAPADAFWEILGNCVSHWVANEAAAFDGSDPEGVHQMRIGLRRLRSALTVFAKAVPRQEAAWIDGETKWLLRQIGPARDWDVFLGELLAPVVTARSGELDLAVLIEAAEGKRRESYLQVRATIGSQRYTAFLTRLSAWLETEGAAEERPDPSGPAPPLLGFAEKILRKRYKKLLKLGRGFKKLSPEARHDLRIALKKLRYSAEFFRSIYQKKRVKPYLATLKELQESLGHLNDVAESQRLMQQVLAEDKAAAAAQNLALAAGAVVGWYAHTNLANEESIQVRWKDFVAATPFWESASRRAKS